MATRGKLGEWENPDTVVRSEDWQEAIRKGCEMVQIASERKVRELERRLDHLKTEAETLRRKGEELRTIHLNLESDLKDSKNQNKAQMESNKKLAQEVFAMRTDMSKLGQFRASLDQAVSYVDSRKWCGGWQRLLVFQRTISGATGTPESRIQSTKLLP